jgi:hypothetical protein
LADKSINSRKSIEDDAALQPSFGAHVPDPEGFTTGKMVTFGLMAGKENGMSPEGIHITDSIKEQYGNLPGSRGAK